MSLFRCRQCDTSVRRGRFCSRCGARQPPRVLRALLALVVGGAMTMAVATAFARIEGSAPEFKPPKPSNGKWPSEEEFLPDGDDSMMTPVFSGFTSASTTETHVASH
jgi:hypothetical protein